eukprot:m.13654 g.13654  ORF g.13654 m.13654 type:complete len:472 (+) comp4689_c0_seq1:340-1755(+)
MHVLPSRRTRDGRVGPIDCAQWPCSASSCLGGIVLGQVCVIAAGLAYLSATASRGDSRTPPWVREVHGGALAPPRYPRGLMDINGPPQQHGAVRLNSAPRGACARRHNPAVCAESAGCLWEPAIRECRPVSNRKTGGVPAPPTPSQTARGAFKSRPDERSVKPAESKGEGAGGPQRWLLYRGGLRGQGIGNSVNGLWVAHLLARRSNRRVCVEWTDFNRAFNPVNSTDECFSTLARMNREGPVVPVARSWNFGRTDSAAQLERTLESDIAVVMFEGNDWPAPVWPNEPMHPFLLSYVPTPDLQRFLPTSCTNGGFGAASVGCAGRSVLHIRRGDSRKDTRGVFSCANPIQSLRRSFKLEEYTVLVDHADMLSQLGLPPRPQPPFHSSGLQTWADWLTVALAKDSVFHTPSAFSESAIRVALNREKGLETGRLLGECDDTKGIRVEAETFAPPWTRWHCERNRTELERLTLG